MASPSFSVSRIQEEASPGGTPLPAPGTEAGEAGSYDVARLRREMAAFRQQMGAGRERTSESHIRGGDATGASSRAPGSAGREHPTAEEGASVYDVAASGGSAELLEATTVVKRLRRQLNEATRVNEQLRAECSAQSARMESWTSRLRALEARAESHKREKEGLEDRIVSLQRQLASSQRDAVDRRKEAEARTREVELAAERERALLAKEAMTRSNEAAEAYQRAADAEARAERMERLLHAERELLSQTKIDDEARRLAHLRSQAEAARTDREHRAQRAREEVEAGEALRESLEQAVEAAAVEYVQLEKGRDARQRRDALGRELQRINALVERRQRNALRARLNKAEDQLKSRPTMRQLRDAQHRATALTARLQEAKRALRRRGTGGGGTGGEEEEEEGEGEGERHAWVGRASGLVPSTVRGTRAADETAAARTAIRCDCALRGESVQSLRERVARADGGAGTGAGEVVVSARDYDVLAAAALLAAEVSAEAEDQYLLRHPFHGMTTHLPPVLGSALVRLVRELCSDQLTLKPVYDLAAALCEAMERLQDAGALPHAPLADARGALGPRTAPAHKVFVGPGREFPQTQGAEYGREEGADDASEAGTVASGVISALGTRAYEAPETGPARPLTLVAARDLLPEVENRLKIAASLREAPVQAAHRALIEVSRLVGATSLRDLVPSAKRTGQDAARFHRTLVHLRRLLRASDDADETHLLSVLADWAGSHFGGDLTAGRRHPDAGL